MKRKTLNEEKLSGRILDRNELKTIVGGTTTVFSHCKWWCVDIETGFTYGGIDQECQSTAQCAIKQCPEGFGFVGCCC